MARAQMRGPPLQSGLFPRAGYGRLRKLICRIPLYVFGNGHVHDFELILLKIIVI
jgi:hypothetical protein